MNIFTFSNISYLWQFILPEAVLLNELKKDGHDIYYLNCLELFDNYEFTNLHSLGLDYTTSLDRRKGVFKRAKTNYFLIKNKFKFNYIKYKKYYDEKKYHTIKDYLKDLNITNFEDFIIDDIELGKIAMSPLILKYKIHNIKEFEFTETIWNEYLEILITVCKTHVLISHIFDVYKFDRIVLYVTGYPINLVVKKIAQKYNIPIYQIVGSRNWAKPFNTIQLSLNEGPEYMKSLVKNIDIIKKIPLQKEHLDNTFEYFNTLLFSKHSLVYSVEYDEHIDIYQFFNIPKKKKIILATMSSADEFYAYHYIISDKKIDVNNDHTFKNQIEWIKALFEFMKEKDDIHLIIRVHPREFPNKREGRLSSNAKILMDLFDDLPSNISINWPFHKLSFYNFIDSVDVNLTSFSTTGMEMALFGIPTVTYNSKLLTYPSCFHFIGETKQLYFKAIEDALEKGWSNENIINSLKWFSTFLSYATISLENALSFDSYDNRKKYQLLYDKYIINHKAKRHLKSLEPLDELNHKKIVQTIEDHLETPLDCIKIENSNFQEDQIIAKKYFKELLNNFKLKKKNLLHLKNWSESNE